jgi:D-xylose 1-dehydrogenase (NADP+, D-xylono-1,5-lactone-forming)
MTTSRVLNWGFLGTGRITRALVDPLHSSPRNRLTGVASRSIDRARALAATVRAERVYGSYAEMLDDPLIDVVYISLPNALHSEWTVKAVQAGKHVLCEKPLATHVADVNAIIAAATVHKCVVAEAFMYRHHPQTLLVRKLVTDGTLGQIRVIRGAFRFPLTREDDVRWLPELGGGSLWDIGCYPVSFARHVVGSEPQEVVGWQHTAPSGVDDTFVGLLQFPGGVFASFDSSFRTPFATDFEVSGTAGTLRLRTPYKPGLECVMDVTDTAGNTRAVPIAGEELYRGEVENLAAAVLDGAECRMTLADSRANVAAIVALYESARKCRPVTLP